MTDEGRTEEAEDRKAIRDAGIRARRRWMPWWIVGTLMICVTIIVVGMVISSAITERDAAQRQAQEQAVTIEQLCARNDETARVLRAAGSCDKAAQVQQQIPCPKGEQGPSQSQAAKGK